ncbi:aspartate--tRNA ligase [Candidatus Parcubacteria bacterium]|nr:aspartate--tRNA ligase [Patescibacteria group bacterium]MBU4309519.1 aspartate--tRNA ligase [Patescibacteria group bacterium]MBU4432365.1 aspartate--tRNA ligase [Patescibacteria group bacterium]MBU4577225.1 aspartate--tRNA ligase [Patescibacteria group bacterium]MCG2696871.1 aspartate--tRNA ligase [Candidatus Parcubacteria bacterium]
MLRTHKCGELTKKNLNEEVILSGWVHSRRDHGGIIFIDLRDRYGLTQIKFDPEINKAAWSEADAARSEWVLQVTGKVIARPDNMVNPKLATGEIEIEAISVEILNKSETPPFELNEDKVSEINEHIRLKYRFVDLRRQRMQHIMKMRDDVLTHMRRYFHSLDFIDVQTPILANSSPEGARDFLIPSRFHPGKFYALPQAPQQFKQLLMVGGVDKYFQIAPCFRDEDPRSDRHQGDFYQVDMEMSFVEQEDVWRVIENLMIEVIEKFSDMEIINKPFLRIPYMECLTKYGSDKPDLRYGLEIEPITEMVAGCGFSVFADMAAKNGYVVHALKVDGGAKFSRKEIDELTEVAKTKGAKGLAYIILKEGGELQSPIVKFLGEELAKKIVDRLEAKAGDIVFFGADKFETVWKALGAVRSDCGTRLGLKDDKKASLVWVVDFPMFEMSELEPGRVDFSHNPFSMPQGGLKSLQEKNPFDILAYQYDLAFNGYEILSGAIRNHNPEIMYKAFELAGYKQEEVDARFGGLINAFKFGAPPHGGSAIGIDRVLMILLGIDSVRDVYAFPKDGQGRDVMMDSPTVVDEKQLRELNIKITKQI